MYIYISFMHHYLYTFNYIDACIYIFLYKYMLYIYRCKDIIKISSKSGQVMTCSNLLLSDQLSIGLFCAPGPSIFLSSSLSPGNGQLPSLPLNLPFDVCRHLHFPVCFWNMDPNLRYSYIIYLSQKKTEETDNFSLRFY